ncbi:MAG: nickel-dependent hydrogenase large subunit [Actinomycetota bacterium]
MTAVAQKARSQRGATTTLSLEPVTRVGGALGVQVESDGSHFSDAWVSGNHYRGYENLIVGRDVRDAHVFASRVCGWCGAVHMTTSCMAFEMAWGLPVPPMALALRTIAECTESIWIHAAHLAVRAGPDYCAPVVAATSPGLWSRAQRTSARGAGIHGYESMAELMEGLTPITGRYWTQTIPAGRRVMEMLNVIYGKYPHPSVVAPGMVGIGLSWATITEYFTRLYMSVDYVKQVCAMWDDLVDFLYEADPRFLELGERPVSFIHAGAWDDVRSPRSYETLNEAGRARLARPGVLVDGRVVTDDLTEINRGIEEHIEHSFYDRSGGGGTDPLGADLPASHPWFSTLTPRPSAPDLQGAYSWCTAPRWRGQVLETTPLGRLWLTALRTDFPENDFIETTGNSIRIMVPMNNQPEMTVEWKIPERANTLERLRADAYGIAFAGLCAALALLKSFELMRGGEIAVSTHFEGGRDDEVGVGLWESGRGMNVHWTRTRGGKVQSYQIMSPSTWNASPRDASGTPGPLEEALIGSPIISEPVTGPAGFIDAARIIHSFDPCMNCGVH